LPAGFRDFAAYLTSRDFDNRVDPQTGQRPITATGQCRFRALRLERDNQSGAFTESGKTIVLFGLNNPSTSNNVGGLRSALAAIRPTAPAAALTQIEELHALGNSFYHGVSFGVATTLASKILGAVICARRTP
jgi:hypothetical protein